MRFSKNKKIRNCKELSEIFAAETKKVTSVEAFVNLDNFVEK
ncbi:hypothetical protein RCH18_003304 [Flavobacterium sp. PL11]|jgi:hypothetical protein|nr:hypothetical protein [Flavobacterium sp. PL11]